MWEIFRYGSIPYYGMSNKEVIEKVVEEDYRLPSPENCPEEIYQWMLECWNKEPEERPSFKELYNRIERKWEETLPNQPSEEKSNLNVNAEYDPLSMPSYES